MFFDGKWPRIEGYSKDFDARNEMSPQAANGKRQELGNDLWKGLQLVAFVEDTRGIVDLRH